MKRVMLVPGRSLFIINIYQGILGIKIPDDLAVPIRCFIDADLIKNSDTSHLPARIGVIIL
jgi:hypothetical protein